MTGRLRGHSMAPASLVAAVLVGMTLPVIAQQQAPVGPQAQEEALKRNVQVFEMALTNAIIKAGARVAEWAQKIEPSVVLNFVAQPEVRAIPLLDNSLVFHVDVSELGVSSALWVQMATQNGAFGPPPQQGSGTRVGGTAAAPESTKAGALPRMTPSQYMTEQVREALINAILDSPTMLPTVTAGQTLTVACNPVDVLVTNPIYRNMSKKLVLQIKGEDLVALRENKISREEAKQRIIERRF
jgi:hypothetical protein